MGLFLVSVRLLAASTAALAPVVRAGFEGVVVTDLDALGIGWLGAYLLANGSVVAAVSLSLFDAALVDAGQLFMLVVGSRLGAAAVVVLVGAADYTHDPESTLRESTRLGLLTFVVSHSIYLPVALVGLVVLPWLTPYLSTTAAGATSVGGVPDVVAPLTDRVVGAVGPTVGLLVAFGGLLVSLWLFDRLLDDLDTDRLRERYLSRLENRWLSFGLGVVVTGLTTSVAFSLGVVVPLYNRGHVQREEVVPYVLGANVGTLVDTLVVAVALGTPAGVSTVLVVLVVGLVVTALALAAYAPYCEVVDGVQRRVLASPASFVAFLGSLLVAPAVLVVGW
ncbi:sodium:phosphate symporter [Halomarina rubra]|uniref:Sodium:phosphate symporter n=1 Tax=Halomarina rubra TaxID=2071873 RepID=A0ABD6AYX4_9EURY